MNGKEYIIQKHDINGNVASTQFYKYHAHAISSLRVGDRLLVCKSGSVRKVDDLHIVEDYNIIRKVRKISNKHLSLESI